MNILLELLKRDVFDDKKSFVTEGENGKPYDAIVGLNLNKKPKQELELFAYFCLIPSEEGGREETLCLKVNPDNNYNFSIYKLNVNTFNLSCVSDLHNISRRILENDDVKTYAEEMIETFQRINKNLDSKIEELKEISEFLDSIP